MGEAHLGDSQSLFVNASTWGLMLTGRIIRLDPGDVAAPAGAMARVVGHAASRYLATLKRDGTTRNMLDQMLDFDRLNEVIGTHQMLDGGKRYE